jgi:hypothetical protein
MSSVQARAVGGSAQGRESHQSGGKMRFDPTLNTDAFYLSPEQREELGITENEVIYFPRNPNLYKTTEHVDRVSFLKFNQQWHDKNGRLHQGLPGLRVPKRADGSEHTVGDNILVVYDKSYRDAVEHNMGLDRADFQNKFNFQQSEQDPNALEGENYSMTDELRDEQKAMTLKRQRMHRNQQAKMIGPTRHIKPDEAFRMLRDPSRQKEFQDERRRYREGGLHKTLDAKALSDMVFGGAGVADTPGERRPVRTTRPERAGKK